MKEKHILIVEKSNFQLLNKGTEDRSDGKKYIILEGIFGVLNEMNKNRRIYTAEQYLPQVDRLQPKIKANKLLGELNHPKHFDIDLNSVSHVIEKLYYDDTSGQIKGKIRILNTPAGEIAQRLVEDGIPLHISSRAAGSVNNDGTVVMKHLFTYDLVAEPGFEEAELTRVNEKYGYEHLENISLYEIDNDGIIVEEIDKKIAEKDNIYNKKEAMDYITKEQFNEYTEYLKEQISELSTKLEMCSSPEKASNDIKTDYKYEKIAKNYTTIEEKYNKLVGFVNYLSEELNKSISHGDHVVGNVMEMKTYMDYLAENLDRNISYTKYLSKNTDKLISHNNHITEMVNKGLSYNDYLAESINEIMNEVENNRLYAEYIAEGADRGIQYTEYLAERLDNGIQYTEHIGKVVNETVNYTNYLSENLNKSISYSDYLSIQMSNNGNGSNNITETYENSILNKLDSIINEAKRQNADVTDQSLHFLKFLDGDRIKMFSSLNENAKIQIIKAFDKNTYYSTDDTARIFENALATQIPTFISNMKPYHKEMWERLNGTKKQLILEQAKNYNLETETQINNFWDTMDLREEKVDLEPLNENNIDQKDKMANEQKSLALPSDDYMKNFEAEMIERMG